jgi:hypothetical protein
MELNLPSQYQAKSKDNTTLIPISGGYNSLTVKEQEEYDKTVSGFIIDEAIETLKSLKNSRMNESPKYSDLMKGFATLMDYHRKITGKDKAENNINIQINLSDMVKKIDNEKIIDQ